MRLRAAAAFFLILSSGVAWAQLDGQLAVQIWPGGGRFATAPMDLPGCEAHLVADANLDAELVYPCGELFIPPPGRYLHWVEGQNRISPDHLVMVYSGGPSEGRTMSLVRSTVPAGRVVFRGIPSDPNLMLRLLHLDSHLFEDRISFEFHRRLPALRAADGARLPVGRAVLFLYDNAKKEYLSLGRPFEIREAGENVVATPPAPETTAVLAVLERPIMLDRPSEDDLAPWLAADERRFPPDLTFGDGARLYAVWYGVSGRTARLELESARWQIAGEPTIALRQGKVEVLRPQLSPLPQLKVGLRRPAAWEEKAIELLLLHPGNSRTAAIARLELPPATDEAKFSAIPARELEVELRVGNYSLREVVDAQDGLDHEVFFDPEPIELEGQVFAGDRPSAATITFFLNGNQNLPEAKDDRLVIETDAQGRYRALLYQPGRIPINVALAGREGLPFLISPRLEIEKSRKLDFHLPANRFVLEALDQRSGQGVAGARVQIENHFGKERAFVTSTHDRTGKDGKLTLPPIRSGRLDLKIGAKGYREATREVEIAEQDPGESILIELAPEAAGDEVSVALPDGRQAGGAQAALFASTTDSSEPWWQGSADAAGLLELPPGRQGSYLLIRHPAAGATVLSATAADGRVVLSPRAPDLQIVIRRRTGDPAPGSPVAIGIGEIEVMGRALTWLLDSPLSGSDASGYFRAAGLPAARLQIISWAPELQGDALNGELHAFATVFDSGANGGLLQVERVE
jgi:hypothetical protein